MYVDTGLRCGERVRYGVRAEDRDGLRSGISTLEAVAPDLGLGFAPGDAGLWTLQWREDRVPRGTELRIARRRGPLIPPQELATVRPAARYRFDPAEKFTHAALSVAKRAAVLGCKWKESSSNRQVRSREGARYMGPRIRRRSEASTDFICQRCRAIVAQNLQTNRPRLLQLLVRFQGLFR